MGLTKNSTGSGIWDNELHLMRDEKCKVVALAGNPNVGKSTVFNYLTGLNQHTGNWPGKTVVNAQGRHRYLDTDFILVDIPGTYSLMASSLEEEIARDFICFGRPDVVIIVIDATCLERNLNLVLQTLEITSQVVVCVNLMDEARSKQIDIDLKKLESILGVPVVGTSARSGKGLPELMDKVYGLAHGSLTARPLSIRYNPEIEEAAQLLIPAVGQAIGNQLNARWVSLKLLDADPDLLGALKKYLGFDLLEQPSVTAQLELAQAHLQAYRQTPSGYRDQLTITLVQKAEKIASQVVHYQRADYQERDRKIDAVLTSKIWGIPTMLLLLGLVFWITIIGANYPSQALADFFFGIEDKLTAWFLASDLPAWVHGVLVLGVYRTLAWVVSVMLPPMAIFFPMFTLLEDLGYLPRVAFNLDSYFKKAGACGKQALTMCMGFGCNAAGVVGCRIIDSPRERLIAIITNNLVPCNGRFPTLIAIITMFFVGFGVSHYRSLMAAVLLTGVILLGIIATLLLSRLLSRTILKGVASSFTLELPPYRKPQVGQVIVRSILDRTLFVLGRALMVAAPAGLVIWTMANITVGGVSILNHCVQFLNPLGRLLGMDGYIIMAFILGFPANEIVVPIMIMNYMAAGNMLELNSLAELHSLLIAHGWTWLTAVCVMLFSLMHFPCGTTCLTIKKETQSWKWTLTAFLLPTLTGMLICLVVANLVRALGLL